MPDLTSKKSQTDADRRRIAEAHERRVKAFRGGVVDDFDDRTDREKEIAAEIAGDRLADLKLYGPDGKLLPVPDADNMQMLGFPFAVPPWLENIYPPAELQKPPPPVPPIKPGTKGRQP